ncbi:hypothetical protein GOV03_03415 [Candidatus Woesearchaeota archaeon]|nr:hypothetical protein [Candidatus Woesearchaeota archaeon]
MDLEKLAEGMKVAVHCMVPIEGQRYYIKNTRLPPVLGAMLLTTWQICMYAPIIKYLVE